MDRHLDRSQTRSGTWSRNLQNLPDLRRLDHLPLVLVSNRLGSFRGRQRHRARLRGRLLRYFGYLREANLWRSPPLGSP